MPTKRSGGSNPPSTTTGHRRPRNRSRTAIAKAAAKAQERDRRAAQKRASQDRWKRDAATKAEKLRAVFGARLSEVVGEKPGAFEQETGVPHSTLQGWVQPGKSYSALPALEYLVLVAERANVSLDWLVGFQVPRRRSEREPVGELAMALVDEVLRRYLRLRGDAHLYVDGIADVLHGEPIRGQDGHKTVSVLDPQLFLSDVVQRAYDDAETIENRNEAKDRELVLEEIQRLKPRLPVLTKHYDDKGQAAAEALSRLLDAAVEPTSSRSKAYVRYLAAEVHNAELITNQLQELQDRWDAEYEQLAATALEGSNSVSPE